MFIFSCRTFYELTVCCYFLQVWKYIISPLFKCLILIFFKFPTDNALPASCSLEYRVSEDMMQKLTAMANQEKIRILSLLNSVSSDALQSRPIDFCAFVVTDNRLFCTTSNFKWLSASATKIPVYCRQTMSNVVEADEVGPCSFRLHFMDDTAEKDGDEMWQLNFDTADSCESAFDTISQCWEKLFGLPLTKISSNNNSASNVLHTK